MIRFDINASDTRDTFVAMNSTPVVRGTVSPEFRSALIAKLLHFSEYDARSRTSPGVFVCGVTSAVHQGR